jgi:hypothetical protein
VEQFATAKEEFAGLAEQTGELGSLLGAAAGRFEELARDSSELAARLETAFAESREAEIGELRGRLFQNCKSCHGLSGLAVPGEVKSAFAGKREELGIGDGYFELGHDLRITHPDLARAQRLADSLRGAILMLEADGDRIAAADGSYERGKTK